MLLNYNIRIERGGITTDSIEIKGVQKEYYKRLLEISLKLMRWIKFLENKNY